MLKNFFSSIVDGASHDCNPWYENYQDCKLIEDPKEPEETRVDAAVSSFPKNFVLKFILYVVLCW